MEYIKNMKIYGLKKFEEFEIEFNPETNIIVGENESGKSTILEAIDIVLLQKYKSFDKYIIKELLNKNHIKKFEENPSVDTLPYILINIEFELDNEPRNTIFYGCNHDFNSKSEKFGIRFVCKIPEEIDGELVSIINSGKIPYDYYQLTWSTFQGELYNSMRKPLKFLIINNDNMDSNTSYNYYNKAIFNNNHSETEKVKIKNDFREKVNSIFEELELNDIGEKQKIGINDKKVIFENIITILDEEIPIENKGSGRENIIKTQIALNKTNGNNEVVAIEEPENHLSYNNLAIMIDDIKSHKDKQLIITTHNSMITNSLGLENVIWIKDNNSNALSNINKADADFFLKSSNNNMLQFILSHKVILVEGPTEFLLIPSIFRKMFGESIEQNEISIIDCGGVKYKRYIDIAQNTNKKVAILTDNDKKESNIENMRKFNAESEKIKIFMDNSIDNWTWESCLYNLNSEEFEKRVQIEDDADYKFNGQDVGKVLGKMLNNKVEIAYKMIKDEFEFICPKYVEDALNWIKE